VKDVQQEEVDESEVSMRKRLTHISFSEDEQVLDGALDSRDGARLNRYPEDVLY
jgi:hypothetical protein